MNRMIPLFPLNIVIFPGSFYPLHIFEARYKKMLKYCIDEQTGFGIVASIGGKNSKIGSYVIVSRIIKNYDNGESDIIVKAEKRFQILKTEAHPAGYSVAEVEDYTDMYVEVDDALLDEIKNIFDDILEKINFQLEDSFWDNFESTEYKSFKIAEKSGLNLQQQQRLLTFQDENKRLMFLIDHFKKLDSQINKDSVFKAIIMNDGYINPKKNTGQPE
jgi:Lon protease-like protein